MKKRAINLMLDSGAYSAWSLGAQIKLDNYIDFLHQVGSLVEYYVNLDVLPGQKGRRPTNSEVEESARLGWRNFVTMRKVGLHPMPVFHEGERFYWLEKMLGEGVDFIGLGGISKGGLVGRRRWLDSVFSFLCGDRGWPPVKIHGFGLTSAPLMLRYPWYSVDSTSWRKNPIYGVVFVPRSSVRKYEHDKSPRIILINSQKRKTCFGTHVTHWEKMGEETAAYVRMYFESLGFDFLVDRNNLIKRHKMMLRYFGRVVQEHRVKPFSLGSFGVFAPLKSVCSSEYVPKRLRIFHGVCINRTGPVWKMFVGESVTDYLVSFLECNRLEPGTLRRLVNGGPVEKEESDVESGSAGDAAVGGPCVGGQTDGAGA